MLEARNLTRHFGPVKAVKGVSFSVNKGEILGFIGPNGAGKSTTMRMLTGYLSPTSGEVYINGEELSKNESRCKSLIGYLPESAPMYGDMTVASFLDFAADIRGMGKVQRRAAVDRVLEHCFLTNMRHRPINTLSKGYRQRTCFAQSILHEPSVLILDEPTDGLDPNQKHEIRKIIQMYGKDKAVILSTHILEEVNYLCDRVVLLNQGEVVCDETIAEFKERGEDAAVTFRNLTVGQTL